MNRYAFTAAWPVIAAAALAAQGPRALPAPEAAAPPAARVVRRVDPAGKTAQAVRVPDGAVVLDGRPTEAAWRDARWFTDFVEKMPVEGVVPPRRIAVAIVYDDAALYVAARISHARRGTLQAPLTRHDDGGLAEHIWISLDTYHDRRTAYDFGVTAAGTRLDAYHPADNEYWTDASWDPVWQAKAVEDSTGWTCEMRIPFSQLRFSAGEAQVWGLNVDVWVPARNEDDFWVPVPRDATGWSSYMGTLVGIRGIRPSRRAELVPYAAGNATLDHPAPGDPFDDGRNVGAHAGLDARMGLGPNLTLAATVNPDFGQVEADPAVVNLSAYEVFFPEKRPFFTDGSQYLSGSGPAYFYSRRIGARPGGPATGDFVDYPDAATILGAAKLTGRTAGGLSIGALGAVTAREFATTFDTATQTFGRTEVAPSAAWGAARVQQEVGPGGSTVGVTVTGVRRALGAGDTLADLVNRAAYAGGADWTLRFQHGTYEVGGYAGLTTVEGDTADLLRVQRSPVHYYQRPDQQYVRVDSSRTSLGGYAAGMHVAKNAGDHWLWYAGVAATSPGFDPNDVGQLRSADGLSGSASVRYRDLNPGGALFSYDVGLGASGGEDFGGVRQWEDWSVHSNVTWRNFWGTSVAVDFGPRAQSLGATRGGPSMGTPQHWGASASVSSAWSAPTRVSAGFSYGEDEEGGEGYGVATTLSLQPSTRLQLSASPGYWRSINPRQYVDSFPGGPPATFGTRYVFGRVDQGTVSLGLRVNYVFAPGLSLEFYAQPFAASGRYAGFGELAAAGSRALRYYGAGGTALSRDSTGAYTAVVGGDTLALGNPDFTVRSFRSNAVLRWEWRPGSTLYLVWQQNRGSSSTDGRLVRPWDLWDALGAAGTNSFAIKLSYWIPAS